MNQYPANQTGLTPEELCQQTPDIYPTRKELDALHTLDNIGEEQSFADFMGTLLVDDDDKWRAVYRIFSELSPQTVYDRYGEESLVWSAVNVCYEPVFDNYYTKLEELGYNRRILEDSRIWQLHQSGIKDVASGALDQYNLGSRVMSGEALAGYDLMARLQLTAREGVEVSQNRAESYGLEPVMLAEKPAIDCYGGAVIGTWQEKHPNANYRIWLDAPVGVALTYKGAPQAVVAFSVSNGGLMIHQLQGVKSIVKVTGPEGEVIKKEKSARGLAILDWQKLMVDVAAHIAVGTGLETISIQEGKNNPWTRALPNESKQPHLSIKQAERLYDKVAKRLGLEKGQDGDWHSDIEELYARPIAKLPELRHGVPKHTEPRRNIVATWFAGLLRNLTP